MISYRVDGQFVILTTDGKSDERERANVFEALRVDPKVPDGAFLIIHIRDYVVRLTQAELESRVRSMVEALAPKIGVASAVLVGDASLRIGLGLQLVAGNMNFRVGVFHDEASARKWLAPGAPRT
ncbi:MAG TPA: hypothetical protein VFO25_11730 [Candidatus Eremiobacteraceae bacterium]|nr:hypothetical protein [Candidatus Eremiobacteraceae bacterium]